MISVVYKRKGEVEEDTVHNIFDLQSVTSNRGFKGFLIEVPDDSNIDLTKMPVISIYSRKSTTLVDKALSFRDENPDFKGAIYGSFSEATGYGKYLLIRYESLSHILNLGGTPQDLLDYRKAYEDAKIEAALKQERKDSERQANIEQLKLKEERIAPAKNVFEDAGLLDLSRRDKLKIYNLEDSGKCTLVYKHCIDDSCERKTRFYHDTNLESLDQAARKIINLIEGGLAEEYKSVHINPDGSLNEGKASFTARRSTDDD